MPFAKNDGLSIYYEVEGKGTPVVLAHGLSMSLEDWREQGYVESLVEKFTVILVDSRGHGQSDKPHNATAYSRYNRAMDHIAVLDHLNIEKAHFIGYSLGGSACLGAGLHATERCITISLGGSQPFNSDEIPDDIPPHTPHNLHGLPPTDDPIRHLLSQGNEAWTEFFKSNMHVSSAMTSRLAKNDYAALLACRDSTDESGVAQQLGRLNFPCLIYVGEHEFVYRGAQTLVRRLPNAEFVSFPGFNHFELFAESRKILPVLHRFLAEHS